jgi:hypothetical protein
VFARFGGKPMDDPEDFFCLVSDRDTIVVDNDAKFPPGVNIGGN